MKLIIPLHIFLSAATASPLCPLATLWRCLSGRLDFTQLHIPLWIRNHSELSSASFLPAQPVQL